MDHIPYADIVRRLFADGTLLAAQRLTGGVSADVFRLDIARSEGGSETVVLRVHGATHGGHPADLEYRLLQTLYAGGLPVPEPLLMDDQCTILKDPYLVMSYIQGETVIAEDAKDVEAVEAIEAVEVVEAAEAVEAVEVTEAAKDVEAVEAIEDAEDQEKVNSVDHSRSTTSTAKKEKKKTKGRSKVSQRCPPHP